MLSHKRGVSSSALALAVIIVVIIIVAGVAVVTTRTHVSTSSTTTPSLKTTSSSPTSSSTTSSAALSPPNKSVLVDDSQTAAPDSLDPGTGFFVQDNTVFLNVYQGLLEFPGFNWTTVVPVVAQNYSATNGYRSYVFTIRSGVTFSTGLPVNASIAWFSFVREAYMSQAVGISNYDYLTVNNTVLVSTGYAFPWGIRHAIEHATGLPATTNLTVAVDALNNILSQFNAANSTIRAVMSYPNQAYVVGGEYTFISNLLHPYTDWPLTLGGPWDAMVDPVFIDQHGGVQGGKTNSYYNENGGVGTGPYEIESVAPGLTQVVLKANPDYWGKGVAGLPEVAQPPHIPIVVINYGLDHLDRVEDFATNQAQISYVSPTFIGQMYSSYHYSSEYTLPQVLSVLGTAPGFNYLGMNTQLYPTNITDFRLALVHAINYTKIFDTLYVYKGITLGSEFLGPVSPDIGRFSNPDNLPMYTYNISLAASYLNKSGYQGDFYVVMPNGTTLGNPSGKPLQSLEIVYLAPVNSFTQLELEIIQSGIAQLGIPVTTEGVTAGVFASFNTPSDSPNIQLLGWFPDWADPGLQEMVPLLTTEFGLPAWMNLPVVNNILANFSFISNQTLQLKLDEELYNITYNYAPYAWLPVSAYYFFVQPYVKSAVFNFLGAYYYNTIEYT